MEELSQALQSSCLLATRSAAQLGSALNFERTLSRPLARSLDSSAQRSLSLVARLLQVVRDAEAEDEPDVIDNYNARVTELVDGLLERADKALDRAAGRTGVAALPLTQSKGAQKTVVRHQQDLHKPQLRFRRAVNNARDAGPWIPLLSSKPHAQTALRLTPMLMEVHGQGELIEGVPNPYAEEIRSYAFDPAHKSDVRLLPPTEASLDDAGTFTLVDSVAGLREMVQHLHDHTEIAIDLEHHDLRSFHGITCLMQISSPTRDFVVDVLDPEVREAAQELNEIFADPRIVKVLHGAEMDIIWLQRDLGIYIVNLFDTAHAARVLRYPKASLAYLLERFVQFKADKRFQIADWRIRPLDPSMVRYARADTHFLLYIYRRLLQELETADSHAINDELPPLQDVIDRSRQTASQSFVLVPFETSRGGQRLLEKWHKDQEWHEGTPQLAVFLALLNWRDMTAREADEGIAHIMSNAVVMALAQECAGQAEAVARLLGRHSSVSHRASEIAQVISQAAAAAAARDKTPRKRKPNAMLMGAETSLSRTLPAGAFNQALAGACHEATRASFSETADAFASTSSSLLSRSPSSLLASTSAFLPRRTQTNDSAPRIAAIMSSITLGAITDRLVPPHSAVTETLEAQQTAPVEPKFVPVESRQSTVVAPVSSRPAIDDEIIVVSGRQKGFSPKAKSKKRQLVEAEPFDYSAVPSVLDVPAASPKEKKRAKKGEAYAKGGPRMPKLDVAAGGRSQTFLS